jgi:hypothetical protein
MGQPDAYPIPPGCLAPLPSTYPGPVLAGPVWCSAVQCSLHSLYAASIWTTLLARPSQPESTQAGSSIKPFEPACPERNTAHTAAHISITPHSPPTTCSSTNTTRPCHRASTTPHSLPRPRTRSWPRRRHTRSSPLTHPHRPHTTALGAQGLSIDCQLSLGPRPTLPRLQHHEALEISPLS